MVATESLKPDINLRTGVLMTAMKWGLVSKIQDEASFIEMKPGKKVDLPTNDNWRISTNWCKSLAHRPCIGTTCDTTFLGCMHRYWLHLQTHVGQKTKEVKCNTLYLMTSHTQTGLWKLCLSDLHCSKDVSFSEDNFHIN